MHKSTTDDFSTNVDNEKGLSHNSSLKVSHVSIIESRLTTYVLRLQQDKHAEKHRK